MLTLFVEENKEEKDKIEKQLPKKALEQTKKRKIRLIQMCKGGTSLIDFLVKNPSYNRCRIFGFLQKRPIDSICLDIFGDIFITYARLCPNKVKKIDI